MIYKFIYVFGVKSLLNSIWLCEAMLAEPVEELRAINLNTLERDSLDFIDFANSPVEHFDEVAPEVITAFEGCFKLPFPYDGRIRFVDQKTMNSYNKASDSDEYVGRYFGSGDILVCGQGAYGTINNIFHEIGHDIYAALSKDQDDKPEILEETFAAYVRQALGSHLPFANKFDYNYIHELYIKAEENAYHLSRQRAHFADTLTSLAMCQTESDLERLLAGDFNPTREEKLAHLKYAIKQNKQFLIDFNRAGYIMAGICGTALLFLPIPLAATLAASVAGLLGKRYTDIKNTTKNQIMIARQVRASLANGLPVHIAAPC